MLWCVYFLRLCLVFCIRVFNIKGKQTELLNHFCRRFFLCTSFVNACNINIVTQRWEESSFLINRGANIDAGAVASSFAPLSSTHAASIFFITNDDTENSSFVIDRGAACAVASFFPPLSSTYATSIL